MNYFVVLAYTLAFGQLDQQYVLAKLNAVTDFHPWYVNRLYLNEDTRNLAVPVSLDPTIADWSARLQVCEEISRSGVFAMYGLIPVAMEDVYDELQKPKYEEIFHRMYKPSVPHDPQNPHYEYHNPYRRLEFYLTKHFAHHPDAEPLIVRKKEYVFMCLLKVADSSEEYDEDSEEFEDVRKGVDVEERETDNKEEEDKKEKKDEEEEEIDSESDSKVEFSDEEDSDSLDEIKAGDIVVFFVSKMYDAHLDLYAHRYVHLEKGKFDDEEVMLVGHSATAYPAPDFNVETHYLELREDRKPVTYCKRDPVCKLNLGGFEHNKRFQLCAIVLKSAYFEDGVEYPHRVYHSDWFVKRVSFQTTRGIKRADEEAYFEFFLTCETSLINGGIKVFVVSRAYNTNQVFVYTEVGKKLYLETLLTNVSVVHDEPNDAKLPEYKF